MKILTLTEFFPEGPEPVFTGGVEARVFHLVEFLKKRHEVNVIWRTTNYSFNSVAAVAGRARFFLSQLVKIILCAEKYDIVEGTNFVTYILAFLYAKKTGAKAVAWYPDVFIGHGVGRLGLVSGMAAELAERLAIKLPWDGVIALSGETRKKLIKAGVGEKKIKVIYGGAQLSSKFKVQSSKFQKFDNPTIICIARLVKYKRAQDLLLAVYFLRERFKDIKVIIVGDGPEFSRLQVAGCRLQVADRVRFLGSISEKQKWELLTRAHIHVLPSVVEGFGLVTVEALAAGVPVVNADIPINREILGEVTVGRLAGWKVKGGLLFRAGDAADLAEKIELLSTDKEFYNQKVKEGMELVKRYDWKKVNRQTERFYRAVIASDPDPGSGERGDPVEIATAPSDGASQ